MSKSDRRIATPCEEMILASKIKTDSLDAWIKGKQFYIADDKVSLILDLPSDISKDPKLSKLAGTILKYDGITTRLSPGGEKLAIIEFTSDRGAIAYNTRRSPEKVRSLSGLEIPMLIDLDLVNLASRVLTGTDVWTRTQLCYDKDLNSITSKKFKHAVITGVRPGNMVFPFIVDYRSDDGIFSVFMNIASENGIGAESRTFSDLFSLTDPKLSHSSITPEFWELICNGKVTTGMTKEECRLSLGLPDDVESGHNWDSLLDVWSYKDGTFLQFQDGLLVKYRHI